VPQGAQRRGVLAPKLPRATRNQPRQYGYRLNPIFPLFAECSSCGEVFQKMPQKNFKKNIELSRKINRFKVLKQNFVLWETRFRLTLIFLGFPQKKMEFSSGLNLIWGFPTGKNNRVSQRKDSFQQRAQPDFFQWKPVSPGGFKGVSAS